MADWSCSEKLPLAPNRAGSEPTAKPSCCCVKTLLNAKGVINQIKYLRPLHHSNHKCSLWSEHWNNLWKASRLSTHGFATLSSLLWSISCLRLWRSAKSWTQLVDDSHDFGVVLVLGDVGWVLWHVSESSHHLGVLELSLKEEVQFQANAAQQ